MMIEKPIAAYSNLSECGNRNLLPPDSDQSLQEAQTEHHHRGVLVNKSRQRLDASNITAIAITTAAIITGNG